MRRVGLHCVLSRGFATDIAKMSVLRRPDVSLYTALQLLLLDSRSAENRIALT